MKSLHDTDRRESSRAFLRRALWVVAGGIFVSAAMATAAPQLTWRLSYDPQVSGCLPWTLYIAHMTTDVKPTPGSLVIVRQGDLEKAAAIEFSHDRNAGPLQIIPPAVKYVAGIAGDRVQIKENSIWINGRYYGRLWLSDWVRSAFPHLHDPWPAGEIVIPKGQILVLGTEPLAFDGRYFGLIPQSDIIGRAWPI